MFFDELQNPPMFKLFHQIFSTIFATKSEWRRVEDEYTKTEDENNGWIEGRRREKKGKNAKEKE